ncbi:MULTISPECIES: DUF6893 family small protein [unclassified Streptomyces]
MLKFVLGGALAAALAFAVRSTLPDIKRYLRMRAM